MVTRQNRDVKKVYVGIDSLLDTRLGTLAVIDEGFAFDVSTDLRYYNRSEDAFETDAAGFLDKENYAAVYEKFKSQIINHSVVTRLPAFIRELFIVLAEKASSTPYLEEVELVVNVFPFKFDEDEKAELLLALTHYFNVHFRISLIDIDEKKISFDDVKDNYYAMFMYNPKPWLDTHYRLLQKGAAKHVTLYTPAINHVRSLTQEEEMSIAESGSDIFTMFRTIMSPVINMEFLPVGLFSMDSPLNYT